MASAGQGRKGEQAALLERITTEEPTNKVTLEQNLKEAKKRTWVGEERGRERQINTMGGSF